MSDLANLDYLDRVNRAIDHITQHLAEPLSLDDVARVACFSPFHFHRVFKAVVGEPLHGFVLRLRLERAVHLLAHGKRPSMLDVALECGFASASDFSRAFRRQYGVSPRSFDRGALRAERRAALEAGMTRDPHVVGLPEGANPDGFKVTVRTLPPRRVAYHRVFRPYAGGVPEAAATMLAWARGRGLAHGAWLGFQWDDPEVVPLEQCRYDIGLVVPEGVALDSLGEVRFPSLRVAEVAIDGSVELELRALDWLYRTWLPRSGYAPDAQPGFEAWVGEPFAHGFERFVLHIHLPVVSLAG